MFDEARTGGASLVEVPENAADALEGAILGYLAHGRPIPSHREPRGGEDVASAARTAVTGSRMIASIGFE